MKIRDIIWAVILAGCESHRNGCNGNDATRYAHFLDSRADCWTIAYGDSGQLDYSLCTVDHHEDWLCQGDGHCWPLGQPVVMKRVQ